MRIQGQQRSTISHDSFATNSVLYRPRGNRSSKQAKLPATIRKQESEESWTRLLSKAKPEQQRQEVVPLSQIHQA